MAAALEICTLIGFTAGIYTAALKGLQHYQPIYEARHASHLAKLDERNRA